MQRKETAGRPARAMVKPSTDLAPASHNACEHASSVAPVVTTSSSSRIRKLSTRPPCGIAKAPRSASHRSSRRSECFSGRGRDSINKTGTLAGRESLTGRQRSAEDVHLVEATLVRPCRCSGTGTILSAASRSVSLRSTSTNLSAKQFPSGSIRSYFSSSIVRSRLSSYRP
jgi:hypothetical protein